MWLGFNYSYLLYVLLETYTIRAVEVTAEGRSIFSYDKGGKVTAAYEQFGKEIAEIDEFPDHSFKVLINEEIIYVQ